MPPVQSLRSRARSIVVCVLAFQHNPSDDLRRCCPLLERRNPITVLQEQRSPIVCRGWCRCGMAAWLTTPFVPLGTPAGMAHDFGHAPAVAWRCSAAAPEWSVVFDRDDFDKNGPAPLGWDLKRLDARCAKPGSEQSSARPLGKAYRPCLPHVDADACIGELEHHSVRQPC